MKKLFRGKNGTSIELMNKELKEKLIPHTPTKHSKSNITKDSYSSGKLGVSDWKYIGYRSRTSK